MSGQLIKKYKDFTELLTSDQECLALLQEREDALSQFQNIMRSLSPAQQDAIIQFIGVSEELHLREMELVLALE